MFNSPVSFKILNKNKEQAIQLIPDSLMSIEGINTFILEIKISNLLTQPLATNSRFLLFLGKAFSPAELKDITIESIESGTSITFDTGIGHHGPYLKFSPGEGTSLSSQLNFKLTNLKSAWTAQTTDVWLEYHNLSGIPDGEVKSTLFIYHQPTAKFIASVQQNTDEMEEHIKNLNRDFLPQKLTEIQEKLHESKLDPIQASTNTNSSSIDINNEQLNQCPPPLICRKKNGDRMRVGDKKLGLYIANGAYDSLLKGASASLLLSYPGGEISQATLLQNYQDHWALSKESSPGVYKLTRRNPNETTPFLGTGETAMVEIDLTLAGLPKKEDTVCLYVTSQKINNYCDNCFCVPIDIVKPVELSVVNVTTQELPKVTIEYSVSGETKLLVSPPPKESNSNTLIFVIDRTTTFKLTAIDEKTGEMAIEERTVPYPQPPLGAIVAWSGTPDMLDGGWVLCDEENNQKYNTSIGSALTVPNLSGRFIYGAGPVSGDQHLGSYDGNRLVHLTTASMPTHKHSISPEKVKMNEKSGGHKHDNVCIEHYGNLKTGDKAGFKANVIDNGKKYAGSEKKLYASKEKSEHTHKLSGTTESKGDSKPLDIMPPYYVLAYIMRVK